MKVVVRRVEAEVEKEEEQHEEVVVADVEIRVAVESHVGVPRVRSQRQHNDIGNPFSEWVEVEHVVVEVEHVVVEVLVENPAKDVNEDVLQEICEIVFDQDLVGKRLREYVLVEVVLEDVVEHVLLKVAVEEMIAKTVLENVFGEVAKALEEHVDAKKMTISKTWLEDVIMNIIAGSDNE